MNYFEESWYNDEMDVFKVENTKIGNLAKQIKTKVGTRVPCHIYSTAKSNLNMNTTGASVEENNSLSCALDTDIKEGYEILVYRNGETEYYERYLVGKPHKCEWNNSGGVDPQLDHIEVPITLKERV